MPLKNIVKQDIQLNNTTASRIKSNELDGGLSDNKSKAARKDGLRT
jgi:hypothetical protein